ncbi:MAG TPA: MFS transporter [Noviherbaspirillum sp.]
MNSPNKSPAFQELSSRLLLAVALVLVALNLRPALTSVGPLLAAIRGETGLSAAGAGGLITLPVVCFGIIAPLGAWLARRFTIERIVLAGVVVLVASILLRVFFGLPGLFIGTFFVGASIGVVMVLLPGIIKRDFPHSVGFMTGLYTMTLCLGAALAAGSAVPVLELTGDDWRTTLALWALPALVAAAVWAVATRGEASHAAPVRYRVRGLRSSALAWQVALLMGLQSVLAYCVFGWLPTILIDRGFTPAEAGAALSLSIVAQLGTALAAPWLATRGKDQRVVAMVVNMATVIGLLGCMYAPARHIWTWAIVLGLAQGGSFSIAMMLVVLRSPSAAVVAPLSGMTQLVGYLLAALGPLVAGITRDISGGWDVAAVFFVFVGAGAAAVGFKAGRAQHVQVEVEAIEANAARR